MAARTELQRKEDSHNVLASSASVEEAEATRCRCLRCVCVVANGERITSTTGVEPYKEAWCRLPRARLASACAIVPQASGPNEHLAVR